MRLYSTGLVITAMEHRMLGCYFAPSLGAAPRWCSFLENLTEEMEEEQRQGLTLVHLSAQPEPFLAPNTP